MRFALRPGTAFPAASMLMCLALVGCAPPHDDLNQWVAEEQRTVVPKVAPLKPPAEYVPQAYTEAVSADPFSRDRLVRILKRETAQTEGAALIAAELKRRKEPLEAYPLDTMRMVGTLDGHGRRVALVRVDGVLYQVHVGEHLGQNFGLVTKISDNEVSLREIAQDAAGEWGERPAALQLQTQEKGNG